MNHPNAMYRRVPAVFIAALLLAVSGCAVYRPAPPPAAVDPAQAAAFLELGEYDIAAVRYQYPGVGLNWSRSGLETILLLVKNKSPRHPLVSPLEIVGLSGNAAFTPLSPQQAADIVAASALYKETAKATLAGSAVGAVIGAGLGALFAAPIGGNAVWQSALIGGGMGALTGAATTGPRAAAELRLSMDQELYALAWQPIPVPPYTTVPGYLYFPAATNIESIQITIRADKDIQTCVLSVSELPPLAVGNRGNRQDIAPKRQ